MLRYMSRKRDPDPDSRGWTRGTAVDGLGAGDTRVGVRLTRDGVWAVGRCAERERAES
jgi:hypothetical protein